MLFRRSPNRLKLSGQYSQECTLRCMLNQRSRLRSLHYLMTPQLTLTTLRNTRVFRGRERIRQREMVAGNKIVNRATQVKSNLF
jgi:hypothetical protein